MTDLDIKKLTTDAKKVLGARRINEPSLHYRMPAKAIDTALAEGY